MMGVRLRTAGGRGTRASAALQLIEQAAELLQIAFVIEFLALGEFKDFQHLFHLLDGILQ